jgi:surface polysaccharide O-acyltransferase-like enzyme
MARIQGIDTIKLIAIIGVIIIHTAPLKFTTISVLSFNLDVIVNQFFRFSVPFFFLISGYFWGKKVTSNNSVSKTSFVMGKKIIALYFFWSLFYLLPYNFTDEKLVNGYDPFYILNETISYFKEHSILLLYEGTKEHLWFLIAISSSLFICSILVHYKLLKTLGVISILLFVFALFTKPYSGTIFGIETWFNSRNGPFFSTIFFSTGYFLSLPHVNRAGLSKGVGIFCLGLLCHFTEIYYLHLYYDLEVKQDFVFGTYFMGLGAGYIALSNHRYLKIPILSKIGQMTLGIYALHMLYVDLFKPVSIAEFPILSDFVYIVLVLVFSIGSSLLLSKSNKTKKLVM